MSNRPGAEKWALVSLSVASLLVTIFVAADEFGLGGRPWFGWWDSNISIEQPHIVAIAHPRPGGAAQRGGLRAGDRIDLRKQALRSRIAILFQPLATEPTILTVDREGTPQTVSILGSTVWEHATFWKLQPMVTRLILDIWFTLCAFVIVLREWRQRDARIVSLVFVCIVGTMLDPSFAVVPSASMGLILFIISRICATMASVLLVRLSSQFKAVSPPVWRFAIEYVAYATILAGFCADIAAAAGLATTSIDPLPYILSLSASRGYLDIAACVAVLIAAGAAVTFVPTERRAWSACLLLPLPIARLISSALFTVPVFANSWFGTIAFIGAANAAMSIGALVVTYALLSEGLQKSRSDFALT